MSRQRDNHKAFIRRMQNSLVSIEHKETKPPEKTKHHTNPKFALRGFSDNGKLSTIKLDRKGKERVFPAGVHKATVEENFYTAYGNFDPDVFEDALAYDIERPAAPVFKEIIETGKLPTDEEGNIDFARFLAIQFLRSPAKRKLDLANVVESFRSDPIHASIEKLMSDETISKIAAVKHMEHWWDNVTPDLFKYVYSMKKVLVTFDEDSLVTSSSPITLIFDMSDVSHEIGHAETKNLNIDDPLLLFPAGDMEKAVAAFYPLSRKQGLILLPPDSDVIVDQIVGTTRISKVFNSLTREYSDDAFFHPNDSAYFLDQFSTEFTSLAWQVQSFLKQLIKA